jgi:hypothetical protein
MAKFVELEHYDILKGRPDGKRLINVDIISEIVGDLGSAIPVTRVKLIGGDYIDVQDTYINVKTKIESV